MTDLSVQIKETFNSSIGKMNARPLRPSAERQVWKTVTNNKYQKLTGTQKESQQLFLGVQGGNCVSVSHKGHKGFHSMFPIRYKKINLQKTELSSSAVPHPNLTAESGAASLTNTWTSMLKDEAGIFDSLWELTGSVSINFCLDRKTCELRPVICIGDKENGNYLLKI